MSLEGTCGAQRLHPERAGAIRAHPRPDRGRGSRAASSRSPPTVPLDVQPMDDLATMMECEVEAVLTARSEIANLINRAYRHKADGVDEALRGHRGTGHRRPGREDRRVRGPARRRQQGADHQAGQHAAVPGAQAARIGHPPAALRRSPCRSACASTACSTTWSRSPRSAQEAIVSRVKVMGKMDIAERRLPQDGRATRSASATATSTCVSRRSRCRTANASSSVSSTRPPRSTTLDQIGLKDADKRQIERYINYSHGIIFVTGPTGSGKTTTLYAGAE